MLMKTDRQSDLIPTPETGPEPDGPLIDWLRTHLGQSDSQERIWTRNYPGGSQLRLYLNNNNSNLEVGYYSWPPASDISNQPLLEPDQTTASLIAATVVEFMNGWQRRGRVLHEPGQKPCISQRQHDYRRFREQIYVYGRQNEIESALEDKAAIKWAYEQVESSQSESLVEASDLATVETRLRLSQPQAPYIVDWLTDNLVDRPEVAPNRVWERTYDCQSQIRLVFDHDNKIISVGYYGWPRAVSLNSDSAEDLAERNNEIIISQIISEFLPNWTTVANQIVYSDDPEKIEVAKQRANRPDGYRIFRNLVEKFCTITGLPPEQGPQDLRATSWARLSFFEDYDQSLRESQTYGHDPKKLLNKNPETWTTTASGRLISRRHLSHLKTITANLVESGLVEAAPEATAILVPTPITGLRNSVFSTPFKWVV